MYDLQSSDTHNNANCQLTSVNSHLAQVFSGISSPQATELNVPGVSVLFVAFGDDRHELNYLHYWFS